MYLYIHIYIYYLIHILPLFFCWINEKRKEGRRYISKTPSYPIPSLKPIIKTNIIFTPGGGDHHAYVWYHTDTPIRTTTVSHTAVSGSTAVSCYLLLYDITYDIQDSSTAVLRYCCTHHHSKRRKIHMYCLLFHYFQIISAVWYDRAAVSSWPRAYRICCRSEAIVYFSSTILIFACYTAVRIPWLLYSYFVYSEVSYIVYGTYSSTKSTPT